MKLPIFKFQFKKLVLFITNLSSFMPIFFYRWSMDYMDDIHKKCRPFPRERHKDLELFHFWHFLVPKHEKKCRHNPIK